MNMDTSINEGSLACCRACLSTDVKLFNIQKYRLTDALSCILGTPLQQDRLPLHACAFCCTMLFKCRSFRAMCLRAQDILAGLVDEQLKTDCVRKLNDSPNQFYNFNISKIEIIDSTIPEEMKVEPIDVVDIETIIENTDLKKEFDNKNEIDEFKNNDTDDTAVKEDKTITQKKRKTGTARKMKEIEPDYDEHHFSEENEMCQVKKKKKDKNVVNKQKVKLKNNDFAKGVKNVERKRKNKLNKDNGTSVSDLAALESEYMVEIVNLSKEEQLEEIAARKKSRNYLESRFRCEGCGRGYDSEPAYTHHLLRHAPSAGGLVCEVCSLRFKVRCRLVKHLESHQLKFLCQLPGCGFVSRDRAHAKGHRAMHAGKTFECQHCGKSFTKMTTYLTHVRLSHAAANVSCDVCGETFVSQKGCRLHKNRMHPESSNSQKHTCSVCSAKFNSVSALERHAEQGAHSGTAGSCEQCGDNCASEDALRDHVREKHPTESHRCEECSLSFPRWSSLDTHRRRQHLLQPPRRGGRGRGARKKYADKPRKKGQFVCEQCGKIKPNAALLRYHQRTHDGVRPFACDQCPKAFTLKSALVWHTRTHTGEKPYQCAQCPRAFSSKANYNRHHKTVHLGIRGHFPCSACARVFSTRSDARVHVRAVHGPPPAPRRRPKRAHTHDNK